MKIPKAEGEWVRSVMRGTNHRQPKHIRLARLKRLKERIKRIEAEIAEGKLLT